MKAINVSIIAMFYFVVVIISCKDVREKQGEETYLQIENFRKLNGRVPSNFAEINIEEKMDGPLYYNRVSDSTYILYYGGGLGESIVFDTISKEWKSDGQ